MSFPRIFSPTVNVRLFDPMPLPRKSAAARRARIAIHKSPANTATGNKPNKPPLKFTRRIRRIPLNA